MRALAFALALVLLTAGTAEGFPQEKRRKTLIRWTNAERVERGLVPVRVDWRVMRLAQVHSRRMAEVRRVWHTVGLGAKLRAVGIRWRVKGELVGATRVGLLRPLFRAFMHSPGHRFHILRPGYRRIGVGVVQGGRFLWVTLIMWG